MDIEDSTKSPEQPLVDTRQPTPPAVPKEDPFTVDGPSGTDFNSWLTVDNNPGLTANPHQEKGGWLQSYPKQPGCL